MKETNKLPDEKGQSLVELAISLTFLLVLMAGLVDFGRAFFTFITLRDAAQEAASYASIVETSSVNNVASYCAGIEARARATSTSPVDLSNADIDVITTINGNNCTSTAAANICLGSAVSVTVEYPDFPLIMPFLGTILGSQTIPIQANVIDTILTPACE